MGITLSLYLNSGFVGIVQSMQLRKQRKKIWIGDCEVRSERFEWERERDEEVGELNSEFLQPVAVHQRRQLVKLKAAAHH